VADALDRSVERPANRETTAFGAAALAGLAVGFWSGPDELASLRRVERRFEPAASGAVRAAARRQWLRAVDRVRGWARSD
jgi:glycerol kinase